MATKRAETPSSKESTVALLAAVASLGSTLVLLESYSSWLLGSIIGASAPILLAAFAAVSEMKGLRVEFSRGLSLKKKRKKKKQKPKA